MCSAPEIMSRWTRGSYLLGLSLLSASVILVVITVQSKLQLDTTAPDEASFIMQEALEGVSVTIAQDDPRLVEYVAHSGLIKSPSALGTEYHLRKPGSDPSAGQSKVVLNILKNMTGGFFVECGALDGETRSNTLYMEKELGWKGLLVEASLSNFNLVVQTRRKAHMANVCLATKPHPHAVVFRQAFNIGKIASDDAHDPKLLSQVKHKDSRLARVQCIPLYTLLLALNVTTVDYFSLDVEGFEYDVLKTIPFDKILIRVLSVEFSHDKVSGTTIVDYMTKFGYRVVANVIEKAHGWAHDYIFAHESVI